MHTAKPPPEACGPKFDDTAVAQLALCRFDLGLPHHPVFAELERQAAQGEVLHNDDTPARLLAFMGERRAKLLQAGQLPDPERVGMFTTAVMSIYEPWEGGLAFQGLIWQSSSPAPPQCGCVLAPIPYSAFRHTAAEGFISLDQWSSGPPVLDIRLGHEAPGILSETGTTW